MVFWKNAFNNFVVAATHYTADPEKRTPEWYIGATSNMRVDQIEREFEIDFESRAGQKAFWFLQSHAERYRIPNIPLNEVPKHWRIIAGLDYGTREPTSLHIYGIDEFRRFYSLWEFYKPSNYREIARAIKGEHEDLPHPLWKRIEKVVADPSIFRKDQEDPTDRLHSGEIEKEELRSRADLLREEGIWNLYRGINDRMAGLERVREMFNHFPHREVKPTIFFCERCEKQWWELTNIVYEEIPPHQMMEKNQKEDVKQKNDHCFIAGTEISTPGGPILVEKIKTGDIVYTRGGPMRVRAAGPTEIAQTYTLTFSNGSVLTCTANHPIWTENRGFVRADALNSGDICVTNQPKKKLIIKELFLGAIQALNTQALEIISFAVQSIINTALGDCIRKFGKAILGQFQTDITCTILMAIPSITTSETLNASPKMNTAKNIENFTSKNGKQKNIRALESAVWLERKNGTPQPRAENGILNTQKGYRLEGAHLVKITPAAIEQVYNMSVEGFHEYFANGILVSNSYDDMRYALMSIEAPSEKPTSSRSDALTLDSVEKVMEQSHTESQDDFY